MTIYHSPRGREALQSVYADAVDRLDVDVTTRTVDTSFGSTHVLLAGPVDGEPVVVFQGGNSTNPLTLSMYTDLAATYRLIAPDTIGHPGYSAETRVDPLSDAFGRWVTELLDCFDIESARMIGTSYGAGILLRTAAYDPDRIIRGALVVPAGFGIGSLPALMRIGIPSILYRYLPSDWLLDAVIEEIVTQPNADRIVRETIAASLRHVKLERKFPGASAAELAWFDAPVALFLAEHDPFFPPDTVLPEANRRLPNLAHTEILRGESHVLSRDAQKRVTASIEAFFSAP